MRQKNCRFLTDHLMSPVAIGVSSGTEYYKGNNFRALVQALLRDTKTQDGVIRLHFFLNDDVNVSDDVNEKKWPEKSILEEEIAKFLAADRNRKVEFQINNLREYTKKIANECDFFRSKLNALRNDAKYAFTVIKGGMPSSPPLLPSENGQVNLPVVLNKRKQNGGKTTAEEPIDFGTAFKNTIMNYTDRHRRQKISFEVAEAHISEEIPQLFAMMSSGAMKTFVYTNLHEHHEAFVCFYEQIKYELLKNGKKIAWDWASAVISKVNSPSGTLTNAVVSTTPEKLTAEDKQMQEQQSSSPFSLPQAAVSTSTMTSTSTSTHTPPMYPQKPTSREAAEKVSEELLHQLYSRVYSKAYSQAYADFAHELRQEREKQVFSLRYQMTSHQQFDYGYGQQPVMLRPIQPILQPCYALPLPPTPIVYQHQHAQAYIQVQRPDYSCQPSPVMNIQHTNNHHIDSGACSTSEYSESSMMDVDSQSSSLDSNSQENEQSYFSNDVVASSAPVETHLKDDTRLNVREQQTSGNFQVQPPLPISGKMVYYSPNEPGSLQYSPSPSLNAVKIEVNSTDQFLNSTSTRCPTPAVPVPSIANNPHRMRMAHGRHHQHRQRNACAPSTFSPPKPTVIKIR